MPSYITVVRRWKPAITLMVIAPVLTELLTGNLPLHVILRPLVFLALVTIAYGVPVLLLREIAVRIRAGVVSHVLLGLIYGIYNEGLIAKTFLQTRGLPINAFDGYGMLGGIETGWGLSISAWHAFYAFLFPIVLVYRIYPDQRSPPWLGRKTFAALAAVALLPSALVFFGTGDHKIAGRPGQYLAMVIISLVLGFLAHQYSATGKMDSPWTASWSSALKGLLLYVAILLIPTVIAGAKAPIPIYFAYFGALAWWAVRRVTARVSIGVQELTMIAFGAQIAVALFALVVAAAHHNVETVATSFAFVLGLVWLISVNRPRSQHSS